MARVLLLFGGRSAEHEVSCVSAVAVHEALTGAGHEVSLVGIDRGGGWHFVESGEAPPAAQGPSAHLEVPGGILRSGARSMRFDVVFPVLHGPFGEDGTIQGLLEIAGIPYVGCDVLSSALGMDKDVAKRLAAHAGIASPAWQVVRGPGLDDAPATVSRLADEMGLPLFVKPAALGSSLGITKATSEAELKEGLEEAARYGRKVIVEEAIVGREIEVAVLEGPRASVPGEIVIETDWYDYDSKYADESSRFVAPAELSDSEAARVRALACRAFETYECKGLARVDFLYEEGGRGFLLNEVNTMPGFTPISGFPKMWQASGMSYGELCDTLVKLALAGSSR
jgi:D-alanine-D-alanine ligase